MKTKLASLLIAAGLFSGIGIAPAPAANESSIFGNCITERIQGHRVNNQVKTTLNIAADGQINGNGGCNNYMGGMVIDGKNIEMKPGGSTMMACPAAQMQQDSKFHQALQSVVKWQLRKGNLILINRKNHEVLRLSRAVPEE